MQATHSPLNLGSIDAFDVVAFRMLDENTGEEPHHVGSMEKNIGFVERHALVQSTGEMVSPYSVLPTHVFLLTILLLLATLQ